VVVVKGSGGRHQGRLFPLSPLCATVLEPDLKWEEQRLNKTFATRNIIGDENCSKKFKLTKKKSGKLEIP
jgi:hypothetical protein